MFYIKTKIAEGVTLDTEFNGEVMTRCPCCGDEIKIDLMEYAEEPNFDIYGTSIYCEACSEKMRDTANRR